MWFVFYGGGTGAFIGVVAAWWIYRKMQKTNDEMIKQIEEISKEQFVFLLPNRKPCTQQTKSCSV